MTIISRALAQEVRLPTLTITVDDPETGMSTTITGTAKLTVEQSTDDPDAETISDLMPWLAARDVTHSLKVDAEWVQRDGEHYRVTRLPTSAPDELERLREVHRIATAYVAADAGDPWVADLYAQLARAVGLEP